MAAAKISFSVRFLAFIISCNEFAPVSFDADAVEAAGAEDVSVLDLAVSLLLQPPNTKTAVTNTKK